MAGIGAIAIGFALAGCSNDGGDPSATGGGSPELRAEVLASFGQSVVVPLLEEFSAKAASLESTLTEAVAGQGTREQGQEAWREAIGVWQVLEVMQFGPAGSRANEVMGGQSLRDLIYAWPNTSACQVDRQTASADYGEPDALAALSGAAVGLEAIEYVLFTEDPGNRCDASDPINSDGVWATFDVSERRLAHAAALATLLRRSANALVAAWAPTEGNFVEELTNPSRSGAVYGSAQEGLNAVSDAMFYLNKEVKDMKVGQPAGLTRCPADSCPFESRWALRAKEHVVENLRGFRILFLGGDPGGEAPGFDDLLSDMGAAEVAEGLDAALVEAIARVEAIPGSLQDAAVEDPSRVEAAHGAIDATAVLFETEVLSVLELEIPDRAAGDGD